MVGRTSAHWIRSWLLPTLGLAVTDFSWNPGHERDQDFYLDVCEIERDGDRWRLTDLYLDIVLRTGRGASVLDVDEFVAAVATGLLDARRAEHALHCSHAAVDGLAAHGHDLDAWLAGHGITLTWPAGPPARAGLVVLLLGTSVDEFTDTSGRATCRCVRRRHRRRTSWSSTSAWASRWSSRPRAAARFGAGWSSPARAARARVRRCAVVGFGAGVGAAVASVVAVVVLVTGARRPAPRRAPRPGPVRAPRRG